MTEAARNLGSQPEQSGQALVYAIAGSGIAWTRRTGGGMHGPNVGRVRAGRLDVTRGRDLGLTEKGLHAEREEARS